jgi:hypothetical protein
MCVNLNALCEIPGATEDYRALNPGFRGGTLLKVPVGLRDNAALFVAGV